MRASPAAVLAAIILLTVAAPARCDVVKPALVEISVHSTGTARIEVRASIEALLTGINARYRNTQDAPNAAAYDALRVLPAEELRLAFAAFESRFLDAVSLEFDGRPATVSLESVRIPPAGYTKVPRISTVMLEAEVAPGVRSVTWYYPASFGDQAVRVRQVDEVQRRWHWSEWQWIREDRASEPFSLTEVFSRPPWYRTAWQYLRLGFAHIVPRGTDHMLFVLGLFLFSTRLRPLLWQVTMFTLAHTLTLGLAMAGVVEIPARVVEPLIALSIAYVGIENLWARRLGNHRLALVFAFGLLHGIGFAEVLQDFGMPRESFVTALVGFNIGVEAGQLTLLAACYFLVGWFMRDPTGYRRYIAVPGSAVIGVLGLIWTVERLLAW